MEQCLSRNPDINVVYSINEPAGEGAHAALSAAGKEKGVLVVSIDGSCKGMDDVANGVFAADATQYPGRMAALGVKSVAAVGAGKPPPPLQPVPAPKKGAAGFRLLCSCCCMRGSAPCSRISSVTPALPSSIEGVD